MSVTRLLRVCKGPRQWEQPMETGVLAEHEDRESQRVCPRKWLCTLCWGSGEQSCILTIVGDNPWAMIPPGDGWGVQGTVATLGLTSVGPQPRADPDIAALAGPLHWGTSVAQAGPVGKSSWKPECEEMDVPTGVHHDPYQRAILARNCPWPAAWKCLCQQDYSPGTMGSRSPTA